MLFTCDHSSQHSSAQGLDWNQQQCGDGHRAWVQGLAPPVTVHFWFVIRFLSWEKLMLFEHTGWSCNQLILHSVLAILYTHCFHRVIPVRIINKKMLLFLWLKNPEIVSQRITCVVQTGKYSTVISICQGQMLCMVHGKPFFKSKKRTHSEEQWMLNLRMWVRSCGLVFVTDSADSTYYQPIWNTVHSKQSGPEGELWFLLGIMAIRAQRSVYCPRGSCHRQ